MIYFDIVINGYYNDRLDRYKFVGVWYEYCYMVYYLCVEDMDVYEI